MRIELIGFSQGVSLVDKDAHTNYLDFRGEDGREFRIPITEEAMHSLLEHVYGDKEKEEQKVEEQEVEEKDPDVTIFGDEPAEEVYGTQPIDEDVEPPKRAAVGGRRAPQREEDVPSL